MHSLFKTSKLAGASLALLTLFLWSGSFAQDFSKYAGTHKGKMDFSGDFPVTYNVNEVTFVISKNGDINITYRYDNIYHASVIEGLEDSHESGNGTAAGKLNTDLSFEATGNCVHNIGEGDKIITSTWFGQISNNYLAGKIGKSGFAKFKVALSPDSQTEETAAGEDCDCAITVPSGLKPGSSLFVITKNTGCVKSEVVFYNGKDSQVSNWDGNAVKVEVQISCCNNRAFTKSLTIPAYQSEEKIEILTTEVSKGGGGGGSLPAPPPEQVVVGTGVALAITTLLQALLAGGGAGSIPIPPLTPPKTPPVNPRVRRDEIPVTDIPDNTPVETPEERAKSYAAFIKDQDRRFGRIEKKGTGNEPKPPDPKKFPADNIPKEPVRKVDPFGGWKSGKRTPEEQKLYEQQKRIKLVEKQKMLEADAARENSYTGYNPLVVGKQMAQTVSASYNEVNDLAFRTFEKGFEIEKKVSDFKTELDNNPEEASKLLYNTGLMFDNMKQAASDYISDGRLKNDLYKAAVDIKNTNKEFCEKLYNNPVETAKTYVKTAVGSENWEHSLDVNAPLEERLLNSGLGILKTCSTISTLGMGSALVKGAEVSVLGIVIPSGLATAWVGLMHEKNLYMPKVLDALPEFMNERKKHYVMNTINVELRHYLYDHPVSSAPRVEKANDWLDAINESFEKEEPVAGGGADW